MPRFDGTGPRGLGPMTGRGEGYCAIAFPPPDTTRTPYGYAGLAGRPIRLGLGLTSNMGYPSPVPTGLRTRAGPGSRGARGGRGRGPTRRW
jgi:hypothetical protein